MKALIAVVAALVLVSSLAVAQQGQSEQVNTIFDVGTPISITGIGGIWGTLAPGTTYTISADGYMSPADATGASTVLANMQWDIVGQFGANVVVTFSLPGYFNSLQGARVPYSVNSQSAGWAGSSFLLGMPYSPIDPRIANTITLNNGGLATVQLGGVLQVPTGAQGNYDAYFVLTAAYTGL